MNTWPYNMGNMQNPYQPRQEVTRVNGEPGARALPLPPNSSALVLDETAPLVWLCQTDGAGYKTVAAYKISPVEPEKPVDVSSLEERIARIEAKLAGTEEQK